MKLPEARPNTASVWGMDTYSHQKHKLAVKQGETAFYEKEVATQPPLQMVL